MRQTWIAKARRAARAFVARLGISAPAHIHLEAIAKRFARRRGWRLRIIDAPLDGADSQLLRLPGEVTIVLSIRITDAAARKFILAHELGHLVLEHPTLPPHRIGDARTHDGPAERDYEAEANAFASELTMPYELVREWCQAAPVTLEVPWRISNTFGTSILASARRFAELSPEPCAAVFSSRRRVVWSTESTRLNRPIELDRDLGPASVAWGFFETGAVAERERSVPASAWFRTHAAAEISEHAVASAEFGTVLSMLWVPERAAALLGIPARI
jgi:hypothetical protein